MAKRGRPRKVSKAVKEAVKTLAKDTNAVKELAQTFLDTDREAKLNKVIQDINKEAGQTLIGYGNELAVRGKVSFGVPEIDAFTGGGATRGGFTVVYGGEMVGKSTLAMFQIAKAQQDGMFACYIDLEHSFDIERAKMFGVNLDKLILISNARTAEEAMDIVVKLARQEVADLIIIDSIHAMSPKGETESKKGKARSIEDDQTALLARKLDKFFKVCAPPVSRGKIAIVLIGQLRTQGIGTFIVRDGLSGGHALKHWALMRLYMRRGQGADAPRKRYKIDGERKEKRLGFDCVIKMEKTKVSGSQPEGEEIHLPFHFQEGFPI